MIDYEMKLRNKIMNLLQINISQLSCSKEYQVQLTGGKIKIWFTTPSGLILNYLISIELLRKETLFNMEK